MQEHFSAGAHSFLPVNNREKRVHIGTLFLDNAPINNIIIPDYPPHGVCWGSIGDFPALTIDLCPRVGALAYFQKPEDSKQHTNIL